MWDLAYLLPNEFYDYVMTGKYPLNIPNPPKSPSYDKKPEDLGKKEEWKVEVSAEDICSKKRERISHARGVPRHRFNLLLSLTWGTY